MPPDEDEVVVVPPEETTPQLTGEELILQAIVDGNTDADGNVDPTIAGDPRIGRGPDVEHVTTTEDTPEETPEPSTEDLILGRFKTNDDVIEAYRNLEPAYTQTSQQMRELERQVQELQDQLQFNQSEAEATRDFQFDAPFSNQPTNVEQLEELAEQHPDRAALFAIKNAGRLPAELVQEVVNYWHVRNPAQATAYMLQQMFQQYMPAIDERIQPHDNRYQEDIVQNAVTMAEEMIGPQYEQYHDRIIDTIESNPALLPTDLNNPEAMRDSIVNVYAMLLGRDTLQRGQQLAAQGRPETSAQATTQTRPAAVEPHRGASEEDVEAARAIQNLILNAQS